MRHHRREPPERRIQVRNLLDGDLPLWVDIDIHLRLSLTFHQTLVISGAAEAHGMQPPHRSVRHHPWSGSTPVRREPDAQRTPAPSNGTLARRHWSVRPGVMGALLSCAVRTGRARNAADKRRIGAGVHGSTCHLNDQGPAAITPGVGGRGDLGSQPRPVMILGARAAGLSVSSAELPVNSAVVPIGATSSSGVWLTSSTREPGRSVRFLGSTRNEWVAQVVIRGG